MITREPLKLGQRVAIYGGLSGPTALATVTRVMVRFVEVTTETGAVSKFSLDGWSLYPRPRERWSTFCMCKPVTPAEEATIQEGWALDRMRRELAAFPWREAPPDVIRRAHAILKAAENPAPEVPA